MASEKKRPNFFILLGLDPDAAWDEAKFKAALSAKKSEWGRQSTNVGPKAIAAQKNRELIPRIEEVMADKALRDLEAVGARKERISTSRDRLVAFEQQLKLAEARGFLERDEFNKLVADFKDILAEKDIAARLKVPVRSPAHPDTKGRQKLDPSIVKTIGEYLAVMNVPDLYQLLGMKPTTSSEELCRAAEQLSRDMLTRQPKTAEVTAQSVLAGHAKDIFQSPDKRKEYDESLRQQSLNMLLASLDESMKRLTDKTLYAGQVQVFLTQAAEKGWRDDEALAKLLEHVRMRKWYAEVPTREHGLQQLRCGNCQAINEKKRQFCHKCNMPLSIRCPQCDQMVPSDEVGCSQCGFPTGNAFWIDEILAECQDLLNRGEVSSANDRVSVMERAWAPPKPDERVQKIRVYREKLQALSQEQQQHIERLRQMVNKRRFYGARRFLTTLPAQTIDDVQSLQQIVSDTITRVQALMKQAQASGVSAERKVDICLQALQICVDCDEARALLSTLPPAAPGNLQAQVRGAVVSLSWNPSTSRGAIYKVLRKRGARPASIHDGTLLATIAGCMYDDAQPEIGVPLFYAIFAAYDEIVSAQPALQDQSVLLTSDVVQLVAEVDDQQVTLRWRVPEQAHEVIVVRKEGARPTSSRDGTRLSLIDRTSLVDRNVKNGRSYFYGIYCLFRDYDHHLISSPGIIKEITPEAPPAPITHLDIQSERQRQGFLIHISWPALAKGQGVVLQTRQPPSFKVGETIPSNDLSKYGSVLMGKGNSCEQTLNGLGIVYYVPAVIFQGAAYMGKSFRHVCIEDVSALEVENLGSVLRMQWTWPASCQEVLVCFDHSGWPILEKASANVLRVSRTEYERHGHYDIRGAIGSDYYIVVAAIVRQDGDEIVAAGMRIQARLATRVMLTYEIKLAGGLFGPKQTMLQLRTSTPGTLPSLLLVGKQGRLPIAKSEGNVLFRQPGPFFLADQMNIPLPKMATPPKTFAKLYLEDDRYCNEVIIYQPGESKLRLS